MNINLDIQHACDSPIPYSDEQVCRWVEMVLQHEKIHAELTLRFVNNDEMVALNRTYRKQDKTTNVLAFPSELPESILLETPFLGDVIVCPEVLNHEYQTLGVLQEAHWAHIIIHGVLHLLGYDHMVDADATTMQAIEATHLHTLGFNNPY